MLNLLTLEVKDQVLSGEPLYVIKDSTGNVLYDNVKLELKTPLVQQGTELNKALFDKIDESFKSVIKAINNMTTNKTTQDFTHNQVLGVIGNIGNMSSTQDIRIENLESRMSKLESRVSNLK